MRCSMKRYMPDLCIAASCNAAVRGVGVTTGRPRLSTRAQCTIRAPARDHELHAGPGFRKRSGVPCGISSWRGHCGGGSHPTCSKGRSASLTKRGCRGVEAYGDPTRNPMRYPGSRSGSVVPWAIEYESRDERKLPCNAKSLPDGCALED